MKRIEHMSLWERFYFLEIARGLAVAGHRFSRNFSIYILHAFGLVKTCQAEGRPNIRRKGLPTRIP